MRICSRQLINRNELFERLVLVSLLSVMWIFFGFNTMNPDYEAYSKIYLGIYPDHEFGFLFLCRVFRNLGLSYQQFLIILSFICLLILYQSLKKYSGNILLVIMLYCIFPFVLDCIQIRSFLAELIVLYSLRYLITNKRGNSCKYFVGILIATSMHYFAAIYLILLISKLPFKKKQMIAYFGVIIVLVMVVSYTDFIPIMVNKVLHSNKVYENFINRARFGFIIPCFYQFVSFVIFWIGYKKCIELNNETLVITMRHYALNVLFRINVLMFILFPFYIFTFNFFRVYRVILIINYIVIGNVLKYCKFMQWKSYKLYKIIAISYVVCLSIIYILRSDYMLKTFFSNNILLELLG